VNGPVGSPVMDSAGIAELLAAKDGVTGAHSAEAVDQLNAALAQVRQRVVSTAEQLYRSASEESERAEMSLAEFDRQSEGALAQASAAVEKARTALRTCREGDRLAQLEADLMLAEATDLLVLRERIVGRKPLEDAWRTSAGAVAIWGGTLLRMAASLGADVVVTGATARSVDVRGWTAGEVAKRLLTETPAANGNGVRS